MLTLVFYYEFQADSYLTGTMFTVLFMMPFHLGVLASPTAPFIQKQSPEERDNNNMIMNMNCQQ